MGSIELSIWEFMKFIEQVNSKSLNEQTGMLIASLDYWQMYLDSNIGSDNFFCWAREDESI